MKFRRDPNYENRIQYRCPGCKQTHRIPFCGHNSWAFNGDMQKPSLNPSVLEKGVLAGGSPYVCHHYIIDGQIKFLSDCTHELKNQTVELPEWPDGETGEK